MAVRGLDHGTDDTFALQPMYAAANARHCVVDRLEFVGSAWL